ncbi:hypothetical protein CspeluHIS016_0206510 [Cutaneotrichosporon spelunceum]|uniref:DUF4203 domain-containing protein n=1 Tax=Cutaneotrichosporon spelunceum TaxID=1672016 RepID=A0AAD3YA31_9TREE|nr:hypothetical protein CspeluHIS016_0206510 [Cutaneotrichosporon spelunceum]
MATLAAPVLYTVLFALLLFCRPRGLLGAATLLLLGVVEGAAIGAALALLGWGWAIRTAFVALVAGAAVFAGLAAAAFHTPRFREGALGAGLLCGLIGSSVGFLIEANATEMLCARFGVLGGTVFAVRDMSGVVARVGTNEAGLGAGVLGMAVILDSVTREASYV